MIKELILRIGQAPKHIKEQLVDADGSEHEKALRVADWILAIQAVLASIKTRRSDLPGSRDYLDFAQEFVAQAKDRQ